MKTKVNRYLVFLLTLLVVFFFIAPEFLDARGGRGGFRSFGGSRSRTFSTPPKKGLNTPMNKSTQRQKTSFGGKRLSSANEYRAKYGQPRKVSQPGQTPGVPAHYRINEYGGFSNGLMMGYLMGHTSWLWFMPFHPAFYFTRPQYVENPDGTIDVYPPTFDLGKLFITIIIVGAIIYYIVRAIQRRRISARASSQSSFS